MVLYSKIEVRAISTCSYMIPGSRDHNMLLLGSPITSR